MLPTVHHAGHLHCLSLSHASERGPYRLPNSIGGKTRVPGRPFAQALGPHPCSKPSRASKVQDFTDALPALSGPRPPTNRKEPWWALLGLRPCVPLPQARLSEARVGFPAPSAP